MNTRVLLNGGARFISRSIADCLLASGHSVTAFANLSYQVYREHGDLGWERVHQHDLAPFAEVSDFQEERPRPHHEPECEAHR